MNKDLSFLKQIKLPAKLKQYKQNIIEVTQKEYDYLTKTAFDTSNSYTLDFYLVEKRETLEVRPFETSASKLESVIDLKYFDELFECIVEVETCKLGNIFNLNIYYFNEWVKNPDRPTDGASKGGARFAFWPDNNKSKGTKNGKSD